MKNAEAIFKHFEKSVRIWLPLLGLDKWAITLCRDDTVEEVASCTAEPAYERAIITCNAKRMETEQYSAFQVESVAVHELLHAVLWLAFNDLADPGIPEDLLSHHEEMEVENVARCLLRARYPRRTAEIERLWTGLAVIHAAGEKMNQT